MDMTRDRKMKPRFTDTRLIRTLVIMDSQFPGPAPQIFLKITDTFSGPNGCP